MNLRRLLSYVRRAVDDYTLLEENKSCIGGTMNLRRLLSYVRRAVDDYTLLEEDDKIAVGVSGGKDSMVLLYALKHLQQFYPKHFDLMAVTVHLGYENIHLKRVQVFCEELQIPHELIQTQIAEIVFRENRENKACSLCARLRKGALNQAALAYGCNKVAYAHHRDDLIETMLLSLIYEGRFHSFSPKTELERTGLTLIRPLMYVPEADVIGFQHKYSIPSVKNPCPIEGHTKRQYVKDLLQKLNQDNPGVKERLFTSIRSASFDDWPKF